MERDPLNQELDDLRAEVERLRSALDPFARHAHCVRLGWFCGPRSHNLSRLNAEQPRNVERQRRIDLRAVFKNQT
jgi:hypothetical protein